MRWWCLWFCSSSARVLRNLGSSKQQAINHANIYTLFVYLYSSALCCGGSPPLVFIWSCRGYVFLVKGNLSLGVVLGGLLKQKLRLLKMKRFGPWVTRVNVYSIQVVLCDAALVRSPVESNSRPVYGIGVKPASWGIWIATCILFYLYLFWWGGPYCPMHCDLFRSIVLPRI